MFKAYVVIMTYLILLNTVYNYQYPVDVKARPRIITRLILKSSNFKLLFCCYASKMNTRELGGAIVNEAHVTGCNLITIITSNKYYMISKDWLIEYCYKPARNRVNKIYKNWLCVVVFSKFTLEKI